MKVTRFDGTLKDLRKLQQDGASFPPENCVVQIGSGAGQFTCICGKTITFCENSRSFEVLPSEWRPPGIKVGKHKCGATFWMRHYRPKGRYS